jgi:hypothetical protein
MLVAARNIKVSARLACFLNFFGQDHCIADLGERADVVRDPVSHESRADVGIDIGKRRVTLLRCKALESAERCGASRTGQKCVEFASLHVRPPIHGSGSVRLHPIHRAQMALRSAWHQALRLSAGTASAAAA